MICTLPLYLCGYMSALLEYEPAQPISGNNDDKVEWLARMPDNFLFQAYICLFICLLQMVFLECTRNWCEDAIVFMVHLCWGNIYVQRLLCEIFVLLKAPPSKELT